MGHTILFIHLKIILLQCFSVFSFQFSVFSYIQTDLGTNFPITATVHEQQPQYLTCRKIFSHINGSCALFRGPTNLTFKQLFIKNESHSTIHTFKNYFVTVFFNLHLYSNRPQGAVWIRVCCVHVCCNARFIFFFFFFSTAKVDFSTMNNAQMYCSQTHKYHFLTLKMGFTALFTYLKIILLQYFQFSAFSFNKISSIQTYPKLNEPKLIENTSQTSQKKLSNIFFFYQKWKLNFIVFNLNNHLCIPFVLNFFSFVSV